MFIFTSLLLLLFPWQQAGLLRRCHTKTPLPIRGDSGDSRAINITENIVRVASTFLLTFVKVNNYILFISVPIYQEISI